MNQMASSQKQKVTTSVPIVHDIKFKTDVLAITSKAALYDKLMTSLFQKCYTGSNVVNKLFETSTSMIPQASMNGLATVDMVVSEILTNIGIIIVYIAKVVDSLLD